jgi:hypothetical protein
MTTTDSLSPEVLPPTDVLGSSAGKTQGLERVRSFLGRLWREDWAFSLALALVALLPRLFVAIAASREPVWDAHYYHFGAERIAAGLGYSEDVEILGKLVTKPWTHYPVGYSAALGLVYAVFGSNLLVGPLFGVAIGVALVVVVHRLGRVFLSENRARLAGTLAALHPGLIAYAALLMTEPLAALLLMGAVLARFAIKNPKFALGSVGLLTGLAALVRPLSLGLPFALAFAEKPPLSRALGRLGLTIVFALATILPWTIRNCTVMDGCALVSTNGGWNLAIGAITKTGRFDALKASDGCPVVTGQVQQDRCWARVGLKKISEAPGAWLALVPKKLSQTYDHESFPIEYLHEAAPDLWPEARRERGRHLLSFYHWLLIALSSLSIVSAPVGERSRAAIVVQGALLGGVALLLTYCFQSVEHPFYVPLAILPLLALLPLPGRPAPHPAFSVLMALLFLTSVSHAIFFGEDRYHMVIAPVLCLLAASALRGPTPGGQGAPSSNAPLGREPS